MFGDSDTKIQQIIKPYKPFPLQTEKSRVQFWSFLRQHPSCSFYHQNEMIVFSWLQIANNCEPSLESLYFKSPPVI
jgi:hypothetical protein